MLEMLLNGLLLSLKALGDMLFEVFFGHFFYAAGWLVLRLFSLGRYPRLPLRVADPSGPGCRWIGALGFFCLVAVPLTVLTLSLS
ncbi:hypothetical protein NVV93_19190 [Pseudomonas sp. LS44]|uniref:hypothetical protein n=1 Tax=Pseudomonas sp. LS44 TaxID=1357074 RepID=UPI00215B0924|nr:hypothetical protein [Pseudomonas sp. LS44]UVE17659.1 hypothetical protein NVV93_19190 [Pseudomonas sp. LS44]